MKIKIPYNFKTDIKSIIKHLKNNGWNYNGAGSDCEPYSKNWCKALSMGICNKNIPPENLKIIDWGCGYGRFLNYILYCNIQNFVYYGFELPVKNNGEVLVRFNKKYYSPLSNNNRIIKFGLVDNQKLIDEAVNRCNVILLGSVFTHMTIEDSLDFLQIFDSFIETEGYVVFSLIMANKYTLTGKGEYGIENGYSHVLYSDKELNQLRCDDRYSVIKICEFQTSDHKFKHDIFKLTRNKLINE